MYYEADYKVDSVTKTADSVLFTVSKIGSRSMKGRNKIKNLECPSGVNIEPKDTVRIKIENHSEKSGRSNRSWALDRFIGFPYEQERGWEPLDGLGES